MIPIVVFYVAGSIVTLALGMIHWYVDQHYYQIGHQELKKSARMIIFCWAWVFLLMFFLKREIPRLIKAAL